MFLLQMLMFFGCYDNLNFHGLTIVQLNNSIYVCLMLGILTDFFSPEIFVK